MARQSQIKRRLFQPDGVARVRHLLATNPELNRTDLADRLCDEFEFLDPRGQRQRSGCLKALRGLEAKGLFVLPASRSKTHSPPQPRRLDQKVPEPRSVPDRVDEIANLELVLVESEEQMRIWNQMLYDEHPLKAGPFVGRQLRYLIRSEHGWLGGMVFAAAALNLADRDRWIGWDFETRGVYLDRVVGMGRFLIRPSVHCQNLASWALGQSMKQLPKDFEARYGYRPLLVETFVDTGEYSGTCYRAANWIRVGASQGQGRQGQGNESNKTVKDIYVYVLDQGFREQLGLPEHSGLGPLPLDAGLDSETWAEQEFGGAPLGDQRLTRRLVTCAAVLGDNPMASFPGAADGDWPLVKGYYRLIDQPEDSEVTPENILLPHREQTVRRMQAHKTVLCIQDGSDLNYSGASACVGLGAIGTNQTGAQSRGLHLHSTYVVSEEGLPLGVLRGQCEAPTTRPKDDKRPARAIPIEEKETYRWIEGLDDCTTIAAQIPHTRVVVVMDREADFFELFDHWRQDPRVDLLVRAKHNRRTTDELQLFDGVRATEPRLRLSLHIGRQSARPKKSKQKARPKRPERTAEVAVRYQQVELRPPTGHSDKEPVPLWIVHVLEEEPPPGATPIEWFLLTTIEVASPGQAEHLLDWYCLRWRIEDWHRVLKSGCEIEELRNESAERIKRSLAIYMVIAWRVMLMTLLGRECPDLPPDILFSDIELEVLERIATRKRLKPPERLNDAVRLVARLGGHLGRKNDAPPGHEAIWMGYTKLRFMAMGYALARPSDPL